MTELIDRPAGAASEARRLAELRSLGLLDTGPEERFDCLTRLTQRFFEVPIALVSLVDKDRLWFKSHQGLDLCETREPSFCVHAIAGEDVLHVSDAATDPRFRDNPFVLGEPKVRFYAGCPIHGPSGATLGTLCIVDNKPRPFPPEDRAVLRDLAGLVEREIAVVHLAGNDGLTGLANYQALELLAPKVLAGCRLHARPATLLYFDLEGFKEINDRFGHDEGDHALREFGTLLHDTFCASDVVARPGGDEFVVLVTGAAEPNGLVERLRAALAERNARGDLEYRLEVSVGVATFDGVGPDTFHDLKRRADRDMYDNKRRRRQSAALPGKATPDEDASANADRRRS